MRVTLLDYGVGNTASVTRAFSRLGAEVDFTADPERVAVADRILLPGVGAFAPARKRLSETGLDEAVRHALARGARLLGLCLGFQLLFEESEEFGMTKGLALLPGRIAAFGNSVRVPHIGWNQIARPKESLLFESVPPGSYVYFVHSFRAEGVRPEDVAATCDYGGGFPAAIDSGGVFGCQFHPEKSSEVGRVILKNFLGGNGGAS